MNGSRKRSKAYDTQSEETRECHTPPASWGADPKFWAHVDRNEEKKKAPTARGANPCTGQVKIDVMNYAWLVKLFVTGSIKYRRVQYNSGSAKVVKDDAPG